MYDRIKWIDCEGFTILSVDYSDLPEEEYLDTMEEAIKLLNAFQGEPSDSTMLVMTNVINTHTTNNILDRFQAVLAVVERFRGYAYAVVGEPANLKPLARVPSSYIYLTSTEHDARNWLVRQAKRLARENLIE